MAIKTVFSESNVIYSAFTDVAEAKASFIEKNGQHFFKLEGKDNYDVPIKFSTKNSVGAEPLSSAEIRIPIFGKDDFVVSYKDSALDPINAGSGVFNTSYDIGYGKGVYGPILVGPNVWNSWPSSTKNVSAYFFKGDKGKIFLRVNANSTTPQTVQIDFKQINDGATANDITIPKTPIDALTANPQASDITFTYGSSPGKEFTKTVKFTNISRFGNVFGPFLIDGKTDPKDSYTTFQILSEGSEFAVLRDTDDTVDFNIKIDNVKIIQDPSNPLKLAADNEDITDNPNIPRTIKLFYGVLDGGQEFAATDGDPPPKSDGPDFSLVIKSIDDDISSALDVYHFGEEEGNNNRPVVIGIHAGAWTTDQNKDEFLGSKAKFFRKRDCIFVNVDYRVSPQPPSNPDGVYNGYKSNRIKFPAHIEDIASSVKWVRDNISKYGGDPKNIILYGHGSGAHLATLLITNKKWLNDAGVDPSIIKGCISSSNIAWNIKDELDNPSDSLVPNAKVSIYNAFGIDPVVGGAESKVDFDSPEKAKEAYDLYSPNVHLQKELFPPILILSRGSDAVIKKADDFVKNTNTVGIASTDVYHYKYPNNTTYDQTTIAGVLGAISDPPAKYTLPKSTISVSQAITDFLTKKISFKFPDNAIIEYPIIDGQVYSAVSGISTEPITTPAAGAPADSPATDAKTDDDSSKKVVLSGGGIFGAPGIDAIQIGYIDPDLGYVTGLSICEANGYAQKNQGTTFVAIDGDNNVNYLNINDVNKLTADFAQSSSKCDGLKATIRCGEPILNIYGGGGVGAKANVIIGKDGSVMGVDLIHKGYGYQYPPLVQAVDKCYFGNGATFEAFLGEISTKEETFDKETDFEDYYVCPPGTNFGTLYDASGKEVGKWDPSLYTNPSANPIAKQVADYESLINTVKNPWWTTRMKKPSKLTGTKDKSLTVFPVSHPCEIVEVKDLTDSTKPSAIGANFVKKDKKIYLNVIGTGTAEIEFEMNVDDSPFIAGIAASEVIIPAEGGEVSLKRKSLNQDKEIVKQTGKFKGGQTYGPIKIVGADKNAGQPQVTNKKIGLLDADGKDENIKITFDIKKTLDTAPNPKDTTPKAKKPDPTWSDFMNNYAVSPVSPSNLPGTDFAATPFTMEWDQVFPYDGDYVFRGLCDNVGTLYIDNEKVSELQGFDQNPSPTTKNIKGGLHTIRIDLENNPVTETKKLPSIVDFIVKGQASKNGDSLDNIYFTFTSEDGKDSFTFKAREKNQDVSKESSLSSSVKAKFFKKGDDIYLDVTGSGTGKIDFVMDVDDKSSVAGFAAKEVRIPAEGSNVSLKRSNSFPQKEKVKASGSFKAGQTYGPIKIIGAASGAGKPKVSSNEIGLLDADGKDKNIKITFDAKGTAPKNGLQWERIESVNIRPNVIYKVTSHENTKKYKGVEQGIFVTKKGDSQEIGEGTGNKIFADFLGSDNDNDDIQIIAGEGEFRSFNFKKVNNGKGRNTYDLTFILKKKEEELAKTTKKDIFDTVSFIDKADRKLWKTNPKAGKDSDFSDKYGISPFDTDAKESQDKSYAGIHAIQWEKINFPSDGTYEIDVMVDDNVKIYIGNKKSGGKMNDGSGLKSIAEGGDEEIFDVKGFSSPGVNKGKQTFSAKFTAGDYRIRAELEQIDVGALAKGNPMILAIKITKKEGGTKDIISKKSWCENPLGAAVTIEAPPVPVPQEPAIVFDKCPPTPMWSTRQPKAEKTWYPVKYNGYKSFIEQISKVPKKEVEVSEYQNVEFLVFGEGSKGDKNLKYLEFLFESVDGKESFVLKGVEPEKDKKTAQYRIDKKIKKNLKYEVTVRISDTKKAGFTEAEQGLISLKGKSSDEATKSKKVGTSIFADFIGSPNDNDDIRVSVSKGDGEFTVGKKSTVGGRTTYELFYELESKSAVGTKKTVEIKPKFIKDKTDGNIYLDMTEYPDQEYELDFKFIIADTIKSGKGLAASKFEITGTNIQFSRYKNGKLIETDNIKKSFKIKGGKKYGPIVFSGADKGASTQIISADQIASYDRKSTNSFNSKTKKAIDAVDFNVILTGVSGVEFKEPKNIEGWSKFMNRYAISPVQPLYAPGTDGGGVNYENSWDVEFPYDGFYKFEAQADNKAAVYVDGTAVLTDVVNFREVVSSNKVFVSKGKHKVKVEVENQKTEVYDTIEEKIFSTKDNVPDKNTKEVTFTIKGEADKNASSLDDIYLTFVSEDGKDSFTFSGREKNQKASGNIDAIKAKFKKVGNDIFLDVTGSGSGQIEFVAEVSDNPFTAGVAASEIKIPSEGSVVSLKRNTLKVKETIKASGSFKAGQTYGPIKIIGSSSKAGKPKVSSNEIGLLDADGKDKNITINFDVKGSSSKLQWQREEKVTIRTNIKYKVTAHENSKKYKGVEQGIFVTKKGDSQEIREGTGNKIFADFLGSANDNDDIQIIVDDGEFRSFNAKKVNGGKGRNTYDLEFILKNKSASAGSGVSGKGTYSGPDLDYNFTHKEWSEFMNKYNVVPASKSAKGATYNLKWAGVEFPSDGQYEYKIQADNFAVFLVDGKEIGKSTDFKVSPSTKYFEASKGKRTIEIVLTNSASTGADTFDTNPTGVALYISKKASSLSSAGKSWLENPMGVSAVIIPPPCPKPVGGKGVIDKIIPTSPGTGYISPTPTPTPGAPPSTPTPGAPPTVPVLMTLSEVIVKESGINYDCSGDPIVITPSNGVVLSYKCNPFGKIKEVIVEEPGEPFTEYPTIDIISETGTGVVLIPVFTPTIAPPGAPPDKIIQVTDLVGLKQTGWIDGRPYYGAVFSQDGLLYTGYYKTVGKLVRVYATLGESITGEVVTPPSAILRTGTDVTNNDPRLDIPGTPGGLVS